MYRKQRPKTLENWSNTSSCPALLENIVPAEMICSVMNGPYNCMPIAKAGAAKLLPFGNSSTFYWYIIEYMMLTVNNENNTFVPGPLLHITYYP